MSQPRARDTGIEEFDAVIIGASFGGLAAATHLQGSGSVLLVDRQAPGAGETSACGTVLAVLERLDALDALEQVHPTIAINAAGERVTFRPAYPFATFDYSTLCEILVGRLGGVEVANARFDGIDQEGALQIGARRIRGRVMVDASGWRTVLARQFGAPGSDPARRSVGSEFRHGHGGCDLEFWVRPTGRPDGISWAFPAGGHVREGVGSYTGHGHGLRSDLAALAGVDAMPARAVHGGVFPAHLQNPAAGGVFAVGDAAGQCLPLSGEGIRPALVWGQQAGRHAARVLRGEVSLEEALDDYRRQVLAHRWLYRILEALQAGLLSMPLRLVPKAVRVFAREPVAGVAQRAYWDAADPDTLEVTPGVRSRTAAAVEQCAGGRAATAAHSRVLPDRAAAHVAAVIHRSEACECRR